MSEHSLLRKDQLEVSLHLEKKLIEEGVLKEDNPLDVSDDFQKLCEASRRGDLQVCQEMIQAGVNINAKDLYDYTPLILASLCGHYETVELLLQAGALCERDSFMGERCLYNALTDRIRNLLLSYDYSKSTDPLQPLASHLTSLLFRTAPKTADIKMTLSGDESFNGHKFILAARSPYFKQKLDTAPDTGLWKLPATIPPQSFSLALRYIYLGELPREPGGGPGTGFTDLEIISGLTRISKSLQIQDLSQIILDESDRRLIRQKRQDDVTVSVEQLARWFEQNVLRFAVTIETSKAHEVKWNRQNGVFADILLQADDDEQEDELKVEPTSSSLSNVSTDNNILGIPLDGSARPSRSSSRIRSTRQSKLYPCHKAMLIRSEFFMTMFESQFREAQETPHLQIIPIDCPPAVLEIVLTFLYTEKTDFGLEIALDVLFAADMLFLEKLKTKAAVVISTLGNGIATGMQTDVVRDDIDLDIYEILRAAWTTRVQRLEAFAARYIAYRLEQYIDEPAFAEIVQESADKIQARQETDTIEILDDIKYYLSERFRLRFEDTGFDEALAAEEQSQQQILAADGRDLDVPKATNVVLTDEGVDMDSPPRDADFSTDPSIVIRTLDGEIAGDEFEQDALNYQILLGKIDALLDTLKLDA